MSKVSKGAYPQLLEHIGGLLEASRSKAAHTINTVLVQTYWEMGRHIVEFEQEGAQKAGYGDLLLKKLSGDLLARHGKGFSRSNLQDMRLLYVTYPKCQTLSGKLSWSHYVELLGISQDTKEDV